MFANTQMMGLDLGFPDVCFTPLPIPIPIPYPNLAFAPLSLPAAYDILLTCAPAHNMATTTVLSFGDNTGIMLGIASATVMGPSRHLTASFTTLIGGLPATRMTSIALQNSTNCPGIRLIPSQLKVLLLGP